ncbi:MAG: hypothetical protein A2W25_12555 [candidate division Zixibacteria bacterium RBG_16_53_22]|nr:MAG: hypothetical protein A2W25_12555 [candidate division Zixibacteria bacterium RBG_16_53_22]
MTRLTKVIIWGLAIASLPATLMAAIHDVTISGLAFNPAGLTVAPGDTVRWTNQDLVAHSATSDSGIWDSGTILRGQSYMRAFQPPGPYPYHCEFHLLMTGTILISSQNSTDNGAPTPDQFRLDQNFPNPFNSGTEIGFQLSSDGYTRLEIFDTVGKIVQTLIDSRFDAGKHSVIWDAGDRPSGIYFYRLTFGEQAKTGRMALLK